MRIKKRPVIAGRFFAALNLNATFADLLTLHALRAVKYPDPRALALRLHADP